jgi:transcriptional regulator GlxA family with amidase domain
VNERVVDDGDILTCGGRTAGLELALWLVERYASVVVAVAVARQLEHERRGSIWRRSGSQPPA